MITIGDLKAITDRADTIFNSVDYPHKKKIFFTENNTIYIAIEYTIKDVYMRKFIDNIHADYKAELEEACRLLKLKGYKEVKI